MKKAKTNFLKFYNVIIVALLTVLGFSSSCKKDPVSEYGVPSATYIVNGTIESKDSETPIENIKVVMHGDTAISDADGKYRMKDKYGFPGDQEFVIQFLDTDGAANGEYQNLDTIVEFKDPQYVNGDGGWYEGEATQEFNVKLSTKK